MRSKGKTISSILSGFTVSIANTIIEYFSDKYDLYRVEGSHKILSTPVLFFILWSILGAVYSLISFRIKDFNLLILYTFAGIIIGWIMDLLGMIKGILIIEEKRSMILNFFVWMFLVPLTIALSRIYMKFLYSK